MNITEEDTDIIHMAIRSSRICRLDAKAIYIKLISTYMEYYQWLEELNLLRLAFVHMKAYLEQGFEYEKYRGMFQEILTLSGKGDLLDFLKAMHYRCTLIRFEKNRIGEIFGRWPPSSDRSGKRMDVVEDIWNKVLSHSMGIYQYHHKGIGGYRYYYLVINSSGAYMQDDKGKFFEFILPDK